MNVDVYKSVTPTGSYVAIPSGTGLPPHIAESIGNVEIYKQNLPVEPQSKLYAVDAMTILNGIHAQGFYVAKDTTQPEISKAGAAIGAGILLASIGFGPIGAAIGAFSGLVLASAAEKKIFDEVDPPKNNK